MYLQDSSSYCACSVLVVAGALALSFGPAHPAAHGVLRCVLFLRSEWITGSSMTLGLLHRGTEKLMELRHPMQTIGYMDRLDYVSMLSTEVCYVECLEEVLHVDVAMEGQLIRVLLQEVTRVANHLLNIACHAGDVGCLVALLWLFEDRELLHELLATWSGARMHASSVVPGGTRCSIRSTTLVTCTELLQHLSSRMDVLLATVMVHRVWAARLSGVGVLTVGVDGSGASGVLLRSAGASWDLRLIAPPQAYSCTVLSVPVGTYGDSMDRVLIRMLELLTSSSVVIQLTALLSTVHAGTTTSYASMGLQSVLAVFMAYRMTATTSQGIHAVEGPKGELHISLTVTNSSMWRCRVRPADLGHLLGLHALMLGTSLADAVMLIGTVDVVFGAVDL
uniref:NADH dehydrogenase subunit 7 n=1 Tax=Diplonema papillatum TaxID=91374 RepID=A0A1L6C3Z7_9EUGL|nr:NADH dehydrogenase subunit 7 [Diplonema papillatum]